MGNNEFKIFLGLELEKNAGTTLNQEITKLTKNGINLKVGLDETSLETLTTAINGVTQQLQKMGGFSSKVGKSISNGFNEANKSLTPFRDNVVKVTEEYKKGIISAEEYSTRMRKAFMMDSEKGLSDFFANQLDIGELEKYIELITNVGKTVTSIEPIGDKINTTSFSIIKGEAGELVREVNTYKDSLGRIQTITSLVNKETGELVATQQSLSTNDEKRKKALESQRVELNKINSSYEKMRQFIYDGISSDTMNNSTGTELINGYNSLKTFINEVNSLQEQGQIIDKAKINNIKELLTQNQLLITKKKQELDYDKKLEQSLYDRDRLVKQMQSSFDKNNSLYSTGVDDKDKQAMQELINAYSQLDPAQENMKRKTTEITDAMSAYVTKIKETATAEQKQQVATEKHAIAVQKLQNAFKNTNNKYSVGIDSGKSNAMEDQIRAFEQLDPLADGYAQDLERIRMNLGQYTVETRENANAINNQVSNIVKLNSFQDTLNNTMSKTKGFYDVDQAKSLQDTLNQMRQMIAEGQNVSDMLKLIGADVSKFGKNSTTAMKESAKALKEEQQLYKYKETMLVKLNLLEQKYSSKHMDTAPIKEAKKQVSELTVNTENLKGKIVELDVAFSQMTGAYQMKKIGTSMKSVLGIATGFYGLYSIIGYLKQAFSSIVSETTSLDDAMLGLHRVTDETTETYERFRKSAFETANEIGGTAKEIIDSTSEFAKLGFEFNEATKLATDATKYATAGEISLTEATDALSASYTVFGGTFDKVMGTMVDSTSIIDLYNKIGKLFSIA